MVHFLESKQPVAYVLDARLHGSVLDNFYEVPEELVFTDVCLYPVVFNIRIDVVDESFDTVFEFLGIDGHYDLDFLIST